MEEDRFPCRCCGWRGRELLLDVVASSATVSTLSVSGTPSVRICIKFSLAIILVDTRRRVGRMTDSTRCTTPSASYPLARHSSNVMMLVSSLYDAKAIEGPLSITERHTMDGSMGRSLSALPASESESIVDVSVRVFLVTAEIGVAPSY